MQLALQQNHRSHVHPGPCVLGMNSLKPLTPTTDRDQTVSRRFEPSSRTALIGEQPNPWKGLPYPLSDGRSATSRRVTNSCFRTCSKCTSRSRAPFCVCAYIVVPNHYKGTFERLRYLLGGDRPSQTARRALFRKPSRPPVRTDALRGWYPNGDSTRARALASKSPTYPVHGARPPNAELQ